MSTATGVTAVWTERCTACGRGWALEQRIWRCRCGGLLDFDPVAAEAPWPAGPAGSMWAWADRLPRAGTVAPGDVSLGEKVTTLRPMGGDVWVKCDQELPTESFKARGAAVMIGVAAGLGADRIVVDSSGNAGKAAAAYARAAGLAAEVHVPASTSDAKVAAMRSYGAEVVVDPGDRAAAARAAVEAVAGGGGWYASHVYQPAFHHGVKTLAFELFDQLPTVQSGTVVVPVGNGTLILGLWLGFRELVAAGMAVRMPRLVAVQAERCAPVAGMVPSGATAAAGIAIESPPRLGPVRAAVLASGGVVVTVTEAAIAASVDDLAAHALTVEPTGAVAWAAVRDAALATGDYPSRPGGPVVSVLTGR